MRAFARDFMAAYNRKDATALKLMYTTDATSTGPDTSTIFGAERIAQGFTDRFIRQDVTLLVRQTSLNWSDAQHAYVATGVYESYGMTYVYDIPIRQMTAYRNTMVRENDRWKIARSVITPLVKRWCINKLQILTAGNCIHRGAPWKRSIEHESG